MMNMIMILHIYVIKIKKEIKFKIYYKYNNQI